jgi:hypothetical protein
MKNFLKIIFILTCIAGNIKAQQKNDVNGKLEAYAKTFPIEKVYLSLDKPYYNVGDTIWFKSILLNGDFSANNRSNRIYVELYNDSLKLVENRTIVLNNGLGYGDFALKGPLKEGTYCIRAYSNWQQNFGTDYIFQKSLYIGNAGEKTWLLDSYQRITTQSANRILDLKIKITNINNEPAGLRDLEVYLMNDKKRVMRAELRTTLDGKIETKIPLNSTSLNDKYNFYIIDKKDRQHNAILPIALQETDEIDLQFMPEGGYMVNNIYGKIAFKALGGDGLGKKIDGRIVDRANTVIATFSTQKNGMGSFFMLPQKDEIYTAIYMVNNREIKTLLPKAKEEGTSLRIDHLSNPDSMLVYIRATESRRLNGYRLLALATGDILMDVKLNLTNGFTTLKLPKIDFPDGIIHFTLFSPENIALNERQAFINHKQKINISIKPSKDFYNPRDSVSLEITATKEDGTPLSGSFSFAATDNHQVKQQNDDESVVSHFLLQSDLKGSIENAGWYFSNTEPATLLALDHLLLAQAWIGYHWEEQFKPLTLPKFKAETENMINGKLTDLFNNPVPNINLTLLSLGKNIYTTDTISNAEGKFKFNLPLLLDSAAYTIKIKNAKGKNSNATIYVDEFTAAKGITTINMIKPWYVNADTTVLNYYKTSKKIHQFIDTAKLKLSGTQLKEVEIKGKARADEIMLNTAWDAHPVQKITEEELKKMPRKTLMDLLKEKIPGFTIGSIYANGCFGRNARVVRHNFTNFLVGQFLLSHVIIDKVNTHMVSCGMDDVYRSQEISSTAVESTVFFTNQMIFNAISAEDIKEITIYKTCVYYMLDITTRSGKGPWVNAAKGVYVYRPLPIYPSKDFYSPKYNANKEAVTPDLRSTIFWDANVVTDENGKARVSFYAADKPGLYTIKMEGTDLFGRFGFKKSTLTIKNKTESK